MPLSGEPTRGAPSRRPSPIAGLPRRPGQRVALLVEYDGAGFSGSQAQSALRTVQGELAATIERVIGSPVVVRPASRLDQGVSAEALPVDVLLPHLPGRGATTEQGLRNLGLALASEMPGDLTVRRLAAVDERWHAQFEAVDKTYRYTVLLRGTKPALDRRSWWVKQIERPELLQYLADRLVGVHDLRLFACLRHDGTDEKDGAREITAATWERRGDALIFRITGKGFLYKQVRGFVGGMIYVAQGRRTVEEFERRIAGEATELRLGKIAPAEGLVLERISYDPEPDWLTV